MKDLTTDPSYWNLDEASVAAGDVSTHAEPRCDETPGRSDPQTAWRRPVRNRPVVRMLLDAMDSGVRSGIERAARELDWELQSSHGETPGAIHGILTSPSRIEGHVPDHTRPVPTIVIEGNRSARSRMESLDWLPTIAPDLAAVAQLAAQHLLTLGRQTVAFFSSAGDAWSQSLGDAFSRECIASGVQPVMIPPPSGSPLERAKQLLSHLGRLPRPCAIFADHDRHALEILEALRHLGLRVPEDMVVLGTGNHEPVQQRAPVPLSSVDLNPELLGYTAAMLLERAMNGEAQPTKRWLIPPRSVLVRQSTDTSCCRIPGINKAVQIVRSQYFKDICVPSIARECGMSVRNLYRLYRVSTGNTIGKDLMNQRMQAAKSLLLNPALKLEPIAVETGLGNARNLCRLFKEHFGQTPGQWRASYLVEPLSAPPSPTHRLKTPRTLQNPLPTNL